MALRRHNDMMATFSMASMTDVIFLLLIFFMVTSTFVFPTGLEVNLPQGTEQSAVKPSTRVYIDAEGLYFASYGDESPQPLSKADLVTFLRSATDDDPDGFIALFADESVSYGQVVEVLNLGAANNMKIVLATHPAKSAPHPGDSHLATSSDTDLTTTPDE